MVDLPGGTLLPAFGDGRVHPVMGDLGLLGAPVRKCTSVDGIVEAVRHWADGHPEAEWITGDGFDAWLAPGPRISFDSDWPVTDLEPLPGIATAVTRQTPAGIPDGGRLRQERIAISTALAAHSAGCAHQAFDETEWGVLRPGMRADVVLLAADPVGTAPRDLADLPVLGTWLAGRPTNGFDTVFPVPPGGR
ncbi:amidohydrolase family protein [Streptomyces europaeiscabiei]|uniref:Amidohydrolase family protein n=1 Tax=Streptomyces europaeiscabiei TaxID=146819 RepID=A0AAJ2PQG1_9ACTN|nr:amidohydrolase family protein [Streptomyces europaeiscabiei]MDX3131632.1 amidohydrolase family protein [Streptomyces europaeiscabiei]